MSNHLKPAMAIAALALGVSLVGTTTASAADKPMTTATAATSAARTAVAAPATSSVWVHFLPTYESDHLTINAGDDVGTVCWVASEGTIWDLVVDRTLNNTGYTLESYLSRGANEWCGSAGSASGVSSQTWIHLHPQANWEHQVLNPGDSIGSVCSLPAVYDPSDGSHWTWDLVVDHTNGLAGFTWDQAVFGDTPLPC
ncbi:hypothetical protein [Streptacidiphilus sp. EB129]|uniref:hypothetical protein n=1 Tax=Streptacidiphilus sp. EB129 TaxID=3156262 RepID=UPI003514B5CA